LRLLARRNDLLQLVFLIAAITFGKTKLATFDPAITPHPYASKYVISATVLSGKLSAQFAST
jgi:hypothetical protein